MMKPFRFGVQIGGSFTPEAFATKAARRPRSSATRRSTSPTTSSTPSSRRWSAMADGGGGHDDAARRRARVRQRLQAPGDPRQGDRDDRRAVGRPHRARHRRGLDGGRLHRARPARTTGPACASTGSTRRCRSSRAATAPTRSASRARTTRSPTTRRSRSRCRTQIPILIGGGGPRVLRLAGRRGRHRRHQPEPAGRRGHDRRRHRLARRDDRPEGRVDQGGRRQPASTTSSCRSATSSPSVTDDRKELAEADRPRVRDLGRRGARSRDRAASGTVDEICDLMVARRDRWGVSYAVVGGDEMEMFAPVVERLAGT